MQQPLDSSPTNLKELFQVNPLLSLHIDHVIHKVDSLGEGGMGAVYRVFDKRSQRQAALKVMNGAKQTEESRQRFLREAQITARLSHPAIPPVYEIGQSPQNQLFMLMKVIEGETLAARIAQAHATDIQDSDRRRLIETLIKVGEAISYAHNQGVVHRDLKPENIMLGEFGEVMVLDWGIAKDLNEQGDVALDLARSAEQDPEVTEKLALTKAGAFMGTPGYAAPEQYDGRADTRSDVFSLGVLLIEALTGQRAIVDQSMYKCMLATVEGQILEPKSVQPKLPNDLNWIATRATEVDPTQRTQSVQGLNAQLQAVLDAQAVPGYQYSPQERAARWLQAQAVLIAIATSLLMFLSLTAILWLGMENQRQRALRLSAEKLQEQQKRIEAERQLLSKNNLLVSAKAEAQHSKETLAAFNKARSALKRGTPASNVLDLTNKALELGSRTEPQLLTAVEITLELGRPDLAKPLLREVVERHPPAFAARYQLHQLQAAASSQAIESEHSRAILNEAARLGLENEYSLYFQAQALARERQWEPAISLFSKALTTNPKMAVAMTGRAHAKRHRGQVQGALLDYNRALELDPKSVDALTGRAWAHKDTGDHASALSDFENALRSNPKQADAYFGRASLYERRGDWKRALNDLDKALRTKDRFVAAAIARGRVRLQLKQNHRALSDLNQAIQWDARSYDGLLLRGQAHSRLGQPNKALSDFSMAIIINKQRAEAYEWRARLYMKTKKHPERALRDLSRALQIDPQRTELFQRRSQAYLTLKQPKEALKDLTQAIKAKPSELSLLKRRSALFLELGQVKEALSDTQEVLKHTPQDAQALFNAAQIYERLGQDEEALSAYLQSTKNRPKHAKAHYQMAGLLLRKKDYQAAFRHYDQALSIRPKSAPVASARAYALLLLERYAEAAKASRAAIALDRSQPFAYFVSFQALWRQGRYAEAALRGREFLKLAPDHPQAKVIEETLRSFVDDR